MSRISRAVVLVVAVLAGVGGGLSRPRPVFAHPVFLDRFKVLYPEAAGSKLTTPPAGATCVLMCHRTGIGSETNLSLYALHFKKKLDTGLSIDAAFQALEPLDSDHDGSANVKEIRESQTYPGDPNDRPRAGSTITTVAAVQADTDEAAPADNVSALTTAVVNTPAGASVVVAPQDSGTGLSPVTMTFSSIAQPGNTTLSSGPDGPPAPGGFQLGTPPTYYELATDAVYSPPITVCIRYHGIILSDPANPRLFHYQGGAWADVTTSADLANEVVCGSVTSLSPFAVMAQTDFTPPATTAVASAVGWTNAAAVIVQLSAVNEPGGSGVGEIRYVLSGAQTGEGVIAGAQGSVEVRAEGITTLTFSARDQVGNVEPPRHVDLFIDRTPPVIAGLPASGCTLWPPNHQLVTVAQPTAADGLSGIEPGSFVVTATSSEPPLASGSGRASPDVRVGHGEVQVRAERSGTGRGRVYTVSATARDRAGNSASASGTCVVPHDRAR
jgi:hypothetical protein